METDIDTPDVSWIQEEETLMAVRTIPPKQPLSSITLRFVFVNMDSCVVDVLRREQTLDVSGNTSRLPKETVLTLIQTVKDQFVSGGKGGHYGLEDILIWNAGAEPQHLFSYAESDDPTAIGTEFTRGSIFYDWVFPPTVFVFHANQEVFLFFRETNDKRNPAEPTASSAKKTKRVRFAPGGGTTRRHFRKPMVLPEEPLARRCRNPHKDGF